MQVLLDRKLPDHLIVCSLGFCKRKPRIDFERLAAFMSRIGLDECVVNPLLLEPGEKEVPPFVWGHGVGDTCRLRMPRSLYLCLGEDSNR